MRHALANRTYARLFAAQVVALLGTGLLTVALGLLAFELAGQDAGEVLATALSIRILAYVTISPVMTAVASRLPRTTVLVTADVVRALMALALPLVNSTWQIYVLVFLLQAASATFTPAFQATIPQVLPDEEDYTVALSLSRLAYDLESLLSPVVAALLLAVMSFHQLFIGTAAGFLGSIVLVLLARPPAPESQPATPFLERLTRGVRIFIRSSELRGLLAFNLVVACGIAMVLVNTVVLVAGVLRADESRVAWLLAANGAGSMLTALALPRVLTRLSDLEVMIFGAVLSAGGLGLVALAIDTPAGRAQWIWLTVTWALLGMATSMVSTPSARVIRRAAAPSDHPALFAAQFSLSHACYLLTYPAAGWLGTAIGLPLTAVLLSALATVALVVSAPLMGRIHRSDRVVDPEEDGRKP
ncbi:MAG: MFS transporter [Arachnia propionica]|uniref:MFS transporter n=1 Tax=Arachnia propionica TaxID=1750 RepID=UPI00270561A0|nr:MFS transporter [Arachnia propionica]